MTITLEQQEEIKKLYFNNIPLCEIAKATNIDENDIKKYIRDAVLIKERKEFFKNVIISGLENGKTSSEVAAELNCNKKQLYKKAENYGIKVYFRQNLKKRKEYEILESFKKEPCSMLQMTKRVNCCYDKVREIYKKHKLNECFKTKHICIKNEIILGEKNLSEIAKTYGVSRQYVSLLKKRLEKQK